MVTINSARHIPRCLASLAAQDFSNLEMVVVDNASTDGSPEMFTGLPFPVRVIRSNANNGFSISQNRAISSTRGEWILCLNPDTRLEPNLISELLRAGKLHEQIGIVCPKILRLQEGEANGNPHRIDSTGAYITKDLRHHDRGSQEIDQGQYDTPEYVFGYTGAVVLLRRAMIRDISVNGEFMDEDFYLYREDADLSWRAQLLGWRCLYTPSAVAWHARRVFANNRRLMPAFINRHSTKNRFLMRINNITAGVYTKVFVKTTLRDLGIIGYVFCREWQSISGLWWVICHLRRTLAKRRSIQSRRRASDHDLSIWFNDKPMALPLEPNLLARWRTSQVAPVAM
jgi:GT2 family glycosyltransferase